MALRFGNMALSAATAMNPATAALSAIPSLFQGGLGIYQGLKANQLAKSQVRPVLGMQEGQQRALENAYNMAYSRMPGLSAYQQAADQNFAGAVGGIRQAGGSSSQRLAAITAMQQNANLTDMELAARQQMWQGQQMQNLQNQLMSAADTQAKIWDYNKNQPYLAAMEKASMMRDAANKNIYSSLKGVTGSLASTLYNDGKVAEKPKAATGWQSGKMPWGMYNKSASVSPAQQPFDGSNGSTNDGVNPVDRSMVPNLNELNPNTPDVIREMAWQYQMGGKIY